MTSKPGNWLLPLTGAISALSLPDEESALAKAKELGLDPSSITQIDPSNDEPRISYVIPSSDEPGVSVVFSLDNGGDIQ